jgi:hypothetical protein
VRVRVKVRLVKAARESMGVRARKATKEKEREKENIRVKAGRASMATRAATTRAVKRARSQVSTSLAATPGT